MVAEENCTNRRVPVELVSVITDLQLGKLIQKLSLNQRNAVILNEAPILISSF
jgi:hypothetical protein